MKKFCLIIFFAGFSVYGFGQKQEPYLASNGVTYMVGDTITLGVGSDPDGGFAFIYSGLARTIFASIAEEQGYDPRLPDYCHGRQVAIKKIRKQGSEVLFNFTTDDLGGFVMEVEDAIKSCELAQCRVNGDFLSQELFEKLILLSRAFTEGSITEDKFLQLRKEMLLESMEGN